MTLELRKQLFKIIKTTNLIRFSLVSARKQNTAEVECKCSCQNLVKSLEITRSGQQGITLPLTAISNFKMQKKYWQKLVVKMLTPDWLGNARAFYLCGDWAVYWYIATLLYQQSIKLRLDPDHYLFHFRRLCLNCRRAFRHRSVSHI